MINTASPASNNVYGRENGFDITKLIHQNMSSAVVQWSKSCLQRAGDPGSTPGDAVFCFFVPFFFQTLFLILFFLLACFPLLTLMTLLIMHLDQYM